MSRARSLVVALVVFNLLVLPWFLKAAADPPSPDVIATIQARVHAIDLTPAERKWEDIGWVTDIPEALRLSQQVGRPVFILTHVGQLDGRC
jgi:hypothetical protein